MTSPYKTSFSLPDGKIVMQELTTYVKENDTFKKITVTRKFKESDYNDSYTAEILINT